MAINFISGLFQGLDNNGEFVPYGLVYFTNPSTGAPIQTYSDSALTQLNTHPVVLSPSGKAYIIVPDATISDIRFDDANGVTIWFLESYDITSQTAINNLSATLVTTNDYKLDAKSYATEAEDIPVNSYLGGSPTPISPVVFSALHYSVKANASAVFAENAANRVESAELLLNPHYANIDLVGASINNVNTVALNIGSVSTAAANVANISVVAGDIANVVSVATNLPDINTVTANILDIQNAEENAASASLSATNAQIYANTALAVANIDFGAFVVTTGDLIVQYYVAATSTPSIVNGDFIITY